MLVLGWLEFIGCRQTVIGLTHRATSPVARQDLEGGLQRLETRQANRGRDALGAGVERQCRPRPALYQQRQLRRRNDYTVGRETASGDLPLFHYGWIHNRRHHVFKDGKVVSHRHGHRQRQWRDRSSRTNGSQPDGTFHVKAEHHGKNGEWHPRHEVTEQEDPTAKRQSSSKALRVQLGDGGLLSVQLTAGVF